MLVGVALVVGAVHFRFRNRLLALGAAVAAVATTLTAAKLAAPYGAPTASQVAWLAAAVLAEVAALIMVIRRFAPRGERVAMVAILMVVGLHFLPMAPAFGPLAAILGLACGANAMAGMRLSNYPLKAVWAVDGGLKIMFGSLMWAVPLVSNHENAAA
jgi:hypothetical protein